MKGVYEIRCKNTGRRYVGATKDIGGRWRTHRRTLQAGVNDNQYLQAAWDEFGEDDFEFKVLELFEDNANTTTDLFACERKWIDQYKDTCGLFNIHLNVPREASEWRLAIDRRADKAKVLQEEPKGRLELDFTVNLIYLDK